MKKKVVIQFKKLTERANIPRFAYQDDACFDLFSPVEMIVFPQKSVIIDLEIASEFPVGFEVVLRPRSGLGIKKGIMIHIGTIDSGYRGSWIVRLFNFGDHPYTIHAGDRIAQGALREIPQVEIIESDEISSSSRGTNGLGSTGK
ncbi:dUTP diphosphatase [Atribacter laminatus]|jgi:dUTP pyrophosphatase|uniref:dUTP diphosphatase n=1 Tax=Atribacter laminatus TaxID=2847778 RepID=A0A7T1AJT4_ATRLM|nr:dUTP diphosphatase [Atribacter laminatus]QPM67236.1 Deoxyuridine 5'-triphosphate nucleotidohydrolase [Atribacter laminatus]